MSVAGERCCVLIPCLNEARTLAALLDALRALQLPVIVVDDGSDDATPQIAQRHGARLLRHARRRGKGEALRSGFREALRLGYDSVLSMDGDGQHAVADVPRLLQVAHAYPGHIVSGARLIQRQRQPAHRRYANHLADWGISWACGQRLIDTQSGQRYYPRQALALHAIDAQGFVFESDILIEAAQHGVRVISVPIESRYPSPHSPGALRASYFRPLPDFVRIGLRVLQRIARHRAPLARYRRTRSEPPWIVDPTPVPGHDTGPVAARTARA